MRFTVLAAVLTLTVACGGDGASGGLTCDAVVKNVVNLLHGEQGDDAFLKPGDIPKLTAGCEKAGNLATDPNAACIASAKAVADFEGCGKKSLDNLIVPWMM